MTKHSLINVALVSGVEEHEGRKIQCSDSVAGEKKKKEKKKNYHFSEYIFTSDSQLSGETHFNAA